MAVWTKIKFIRYNQTRTYFGREWAVINEKGDGRWPKSVVKRYWTNKRWKHHIPSYICNYTVVTIYQVRLFSCIASKHRVYFPIFITGSFFFIAEGLQLFVLPSSFIWFCSIIYIFRVKTRKIGYVFQTKDNTFWMNEQGYLKCPWIGKN